MNTTEEILDKARSAAWEAALKTLSDAGVQFDDSDLGVYVDDAKAKETYLMNITIEKLPEYGGEA